jgi:endo-1,4-beta-xylanase
MRLFAHILFAVLSSVVVSSAPPSLHQLFTSHGKLYFGAAVSTQNLSPSNRASSLVPAVFGQVTPENSMKWEPTERSRGQHSWSEADQLVDYAKNHSLLVRGHTTIWHSQMPGWVNAIKDKEEMKSVIRQRTRDSVGRWKGRIYAWVFSSSCLNRVLMT